MSAWTLRGIACLAFALLAGTSAVAQDQSADLSVSAVDLQDPVQAGDAITYSVTITNPSTLVFPRVELVLEAHNGLKITSVEIARTQLPNLAGARNVYSVHTPVPPGALTATVRGVAERSSEGKVLLDASVATKSRRMSDSDTSNNRVVHDTTIVVPAPASGEALETGGSPSDRILIDLAVTVSEDRDPVSEGEPYVYTVTARNLGPTAVPRYSVSVTTSEFQIVEPRWYNGATLTFGPLAPNETATHEVRGVAGKPGTATFEIVVSSPLKHHIERSEANNRHRESTQVVARTIAPPPLPGGFVYMSCDLGVTMRSIPETVDDGEIFYFDVDVYRGPGVTPPDVKLWITAPAGVDLLGIGSAGAWPAGTVRVKDAMTVEVLLVPRKPTNVRVVARANLPGGGTVVTEGFVSSAIRENDDTDNLRRVSTTIRPKIPAEEGSHLEAPGGDTGGAQPPETPSTPAEPPGSTEPPPSTGDTPPAPPPVAPPPGAGTPPGTPPAGQTPPGGAGAPATTETSPAPDGQSQANVAITNYVAAELIDWKDPVEHGEDIYYTIKLLRGAANPNSIYSVEISAGPGIVFQHATCSTRLVLEGVGTSRLMMSNPGKPVFRDGRRSRLEEVLWDPLREQQTFDILVRATADLPGGGTVPVEVRVGELHIGSDLILRYLEKTVRASGTTTILPRLPESYIQGLPQALSTAPSPSPTVNAPGDGKPDSTLAPTPPPTLKGVTPQNPEGDLFNPNLIDLLFPPRGSTPPPPPPPADKPDLKIGMSFDPQQVIGGNNGTILINLQNAGSGNATGVVLRLNLPQQAVFQTATPPQGNCTATVGGVECTAGSAASGASLQFPFVFRADSSASGTFSATATLALNETDANPSDNQTSGSFMIVPPAPSDADLSVTGSAEPPTFVAGSAGTYTWRVGNGGPGTASATVGTLSLPELYASITPIFVGKGSCSQTGREVRCQFGDLASGETVDVRIDGTVSGSATTSLTATASVSSQTPDPNASNNQARLTVPVQPAPPAGADVQMTTNAPTSIGTGQVLRYFHQVINNGPSTATGIVVTNTIDDNATFVSCSPTCTPPPAGGKVVQCTVPDLARLTTSALFVDVRAPATPGTIVNQATVTAAETDPMPSNNTRSFSTTVIGPAPTSCALGVQPGNYSGDGGCGATGTAQVTCNSSTELKIQNAALNLTCDASGNCGTNNIVFGQPNHVCMAESPGTTRIFVHCEQTGTPNTCDQQFVRQ